MVPCNVLCLLHLPDQQRVVCGCEDGTIRLHTLDGRMPPVGASSCGGLQQQSSAGAQQARDPGGGLLPTVWTGMRSIYPNPRCPGRLCLHPLSLCVGHWLPCFEWNARFSSRCDRHGELL